MAYAAGAGPSAVDDLLDSLDDGDRGGLDHRLNDDVVEMVRHWRNEKVRETKLGGIARAFFLRGGFAKRYMPPAPHSPGGAQPP